MVTVFQYLFVCAETDQRAAFDLVVQSTIPQALLKGHTCTT